ncbi:MAG: hypothetical protein ABJC62_10530, partial [Frankiaceae bacterium]
MSPPPVSWVALLESETPVDARYAATATSPDGRFAGWFYGWVTPAQPHPAALRIDPRILCGDGPPVLASLVLPAPDARPLMDDPAVFEARRASLRQQSPAARSTLSADPVHWA